MYEVSLLLESFLNAYFTLFIIIPSFSKCISESFKNEILKTTKWYLKDKLENILKKRQGQYS